MGEVWFKRVICILSLEPILAIIPHSRHLQRKRLRVF